MSWRVHLALGRVSNLPTVWTNVLAGATLAGAPFAAGVLGVLLLGLSLFYVGGMYLNDAFDRKIDAVERPERPIPSGRVSAREVFAVGYVLLALGLALLLAASWWHGGRVGAPLAAGLVLAGLIVYYDARHKADPLSPLLMGLCRVLVYVATALALAGRLPVAVLIGAVVLLSYLIGLTYVAKQETLSQYRNLWPLAFLVAPFVYGARALGADAEGAAIYVAIYLGFLAWVGLAVSFLVRKGRINIPRAVINLIAGISLLDALLIGGAGRADLAGLGVVGFVLTLFFQRFVRGT